jgi:hypothetical protein
MQMMTTTASSRHAMEFSVFDVRADADHERNTRDVTALLGKNPR